MTSIHKTLCISFPRSGHHLLESALEGYFGKALHYCEYYGHCGRIPCTDPQTNFQKSHDFQLDVLNDPMYHYIIQYRNPMESIISWYELERNTGEIVDDDEKGWVSFCHEKMVFWKKFVHKWIIENLNLESCHLNYEDFVTSPCAKLAEIITFLQSSTPDVELISEVVKSCDINGQRRDVRRFQYYDEKFFKEMEGMVSNELQYLGLRSHSIY